VAIDLRQLPIAITGASSGIGLATAMACARAGMAVALGARREERLREAAARINAEGGRAIAVRCDVTNRSDCDELIRRTVEAFGGVYAVFANAGYGLEGPAHRLDERAFRDEMETNFWGTLHTIRAALPAMFEAGRGHVLICTSVVSKMSIPYLSAYTSSKAAQDHLGRAMRAELRGRVHVSTVHPIGTDTEFSEVVTKHAGGRPRMARAPRGMRQTPEVVADAIVRCLRRPRGEVWTSRTARLVAALGTAWPWLADSILARRFPPDGSGPG
jgi:NADP-dependent 3-hydroxy acid dehydrogenase YdfG